MAGDFSPTRIITLFYPPTPEQRQDIINRLNGLGGLERVPSAESKVIWDNDNRVFREQIRSLSDSRNLKDGESHLTRLISRCFDCGRVEKVEIKPLGQGKSDATVFRLCVETRPAGTAEANNQEFLLKIYQAGAVWKLESEIRGHMLASQGVGHPGYREHIPNVNNILLWLRHRHPFLIDFPFYQEGGHALQDFARLEVEIKFALLDRQKDSPENRLKAFEHTYSQMPIWQEMENHLLDQWDQKVSRWVSKGYSKNVQLCYELVQTVRRKAREVQQNDLPAGPPPGDFLSEYMPALLYETVRAIGYPSLSVFKRLLAVYSAGSILTRLNCFPDLS